MMIAKYWEQTGYVNSAKNNPNKNRAMVDLTAIQGVIAQEEFLAMPKMRIILETCNVIQRFRNKREIDQIDEIPQRNASKFAKLLEYYQNPHLTFLFSKISCYYFFPLVYDQNTYLDQSIHLVKNKGSQKNGGKIHKFSYSKNMEKFEGLHSSISFTINFIFLKSVQFTTTHIKLCDFSKCNLWCNTTFQKISNR